MRIGTVLLTLAAALALAACDSGDDDSGDSGAGTAEQTETQKQQAQKPEKRDPNSCDAKGINARDGKTGTCNLNDKKFTVVNRNQTLGLTELDARFLRISATDSVTGPAGEVPAEEGQIFVLARVQVTNKTDQPQRFNEEGRQVRFRLGGQSYSFAPNGENALPGSFFNLNRDIPPGGSQRGTVVFRAKKGVERGFRQRGVDPQLLFWNWSTASGEEGPDGAIRLWQ